MDETSKRIINATLALMGSTQTVDELDAIRQRAATTIETYACKTTAEQKALPVTVQDSRLVARYSALMGANGMVTVAEMFDGIDAAIEASYNLGRLSVTNSKPQQEAAKV